MSQFVDNFKGGSGKDEYTFRIILMQHLKRILQLASNEFRGGYWTEKIVLSSGGVQQKERVYIPDTREEYGNAVEALHDLLLPYFCDGIDEEDKNLQSISQTITEDIEKKRKDFINSVGGNVREVLSEDYYKSDSDKRTLEGYKYARLSLHRKLFQNLSIYMKRKGYFLDDGIEE